MATRAVGLDVGTHAVRAAELALGRDDATLVRFGQVTLPPGAVRDGEVADPPAVAGAIRRLWSEAGFRARRVIVGVGNQRVIVRQAELPALSEEDLRSALQFEAPELVPIPIEEALLDFQVLEHFVGADDAAMVRVLLVAAQRDMVRSLLAAVEGAGLEATMVDAVPFALLRALAGATAHLASDRGPAEAIVDVGAGVTNVVVHEAGVPRFVRILATGGAALTEAIAADLGVDLDMAEDLKRRAQPGSLDQLEARAARLIDERVRPLVDEIRGSLDFYQAQAGAAAISRVLLSGGGSRLRGLAERLRGELGLPVEAAHPLLGIRVGRTGIPEEQLVDAEPLLATPIGLALAGRPPETGRRLNLLPREVAAVREQRRAGMLVATGVGVLALGLGLVWAAGRGQVSAARDDAAAAEATVARLRAQVAGLQGVSQLEALLEARRQMVTAALADDVSWTRLLTQIATVIPNDVWLTSFSAQKTGRAPDGTATGTVNVSAMGFDHTSAARWLLRVGELPSLTGLWLPSSTRSGAGAESLVSFQSTAQLTPAAHTDRSRRYLGEEG
jgi:type IV pilus assembly protein PilM